jgi:hypothetical protein
MPARIKAAALAANNPVLPMWKPSVGSTVRVLSSSQRRLRAVNRSPVRENFSLMSTGM